MGGVDIRGWIYDIIYIDAGAMVPCTTNGALQSTHEYPNNDIDIDHYAFDTGVIEERVQWKLVMPEDWNRGWGIKAGALSDSDAIDATLGTPQVISDALLANDGVDLQISAATPALTVAGNPALNNLIVFEVYRNTDGADVMAEDAWLFGVIIQYKKTRYAASW
jgi:hypothetical protein